MFIRALIMAFWVSYDHLGQLILLNLGCILLLTPFGGLIYGAVLTEGTPPFIPGALFGVVMILGILLPLMTVGLAFMAKEIIETREGHLRSFFTGIRLFGLRAMGTALLLVGAMGVFLLSAWFYLRIFADAYPLVGYSLSVLSLWGAVFTLLIAMYVPVALVQKKAGVLTTIKLCLMLVIGNPGYTLGIALVCLLWLAACLAPPVLFLFSLAPLMVLLSSAYEMLSRYYEALGADNAQALLQQPAVLYGDEEDDFLNRGIRDFFYPWKI